MAEEKKVRALTQKKDNVSNQPPTVSKEEDGSSQKTKQRSHASIVRRRIILLLVKIAFFAALFYIVFFVIFGVSRMSDSSMYPAIHDGDLLVYYRIESNYGNGDVVVIDHNGEERVMRIVASPGQEVDISEEGELKVDGQPPAFQAFYETKRAGIYAFRYPYKVSANCYFMLDDYRSNTNDSRSYGEICKDSIKGRLITKIQVRDL